MKKDPQDKSNYPLRESLDREDIDIDKKRCHALHTLHTLHRKEEKRTQICVRMRKSIHDAVGKYCAIENMTIGQFYEEAGILFMDINPPTNAKLIVNKVEVSQTDLKERVLQQICMNEAETLADNLRKISNQGNGIHPNKLQSIYKFFKEYTKLSNPPDELNALVEEILSYVE